VRKRKVLVEPVQHLREPLLLIANFPVHMFLEPRADAVQELSTAFVARNPHD
jgi:hypothetical protein